MSDDLRASTDREIWREVPDDSYSPSIHVTSGGGIGINVGGTVIVRPVREWHCLASPDMLALLRRFYDQTYGKTDLIPPLDFEQARAIFARAEG